VEAVEIDGRKIFLAGVADPGRKVRAYVDDVPFGETETSPAGRFLIEAEFEVRVGDHVIHVEVLEPGGIKVMAEATVPFEREPGEAIAAVAPTAPDAVASAPLPTTREARSPLRPNGLPRNSKMSRTPSSYGAVTLCGGFRTAFMAMACATPLSISPMKRRSATLTESGPDRSSRFLTRTPEGEPANMRAVGEQATTTSMQ
jgi:hypothetical protein